MENIREVQDELRRMEAMLGANCVTPEDLAKFHMYMEGLFTEVGHPTNEIGFDFKVTE